jgi:hypothetical protein
VVHRFGGRSVATGKVWRGGDLLEVGEVGGRNGKTRSPLANRSGSHCFEAQPVPPLPPCVGFQLSAQDVTLPRTGRNSDLGDGGAVLM